VLTPKDTEDDVVFVMLMEKMMGGGLRTWYLIDRRTPKSVVPPHTTSEANELQGEKDNTSQAVASGLHGSSQSTHTDKESS
jgi:hypothetical protein